MVVIVTFQKGIVRHVGPASARQYQWIRVTPEHAGAKQLSVFGGRAQGPIDQADQ
jgi:hypothetical protein